MSTAWPPMLGHQWEDLGQMAPYGNGYRREAADGGTLTAYVLGDRPNTSLMVTYLGTPGRLPTWLEAAEARYRFVSPHVTMALLLPAPGNLPEHPNTLYLWEVNDR